MSGGDPDEGHDLVSIGGAMIDRYYRLSNLPARDGGAFVREAWRDFGGAAANVASVVARLDRRVAMVSRLGTDEPTAGSDAGTYDGADAVLADLRGRGIDASRVRQGAETGTYSMILAGPDGGRMVVTGGDSVRTMRLEPADWPVLRSARTVFTNAYAPDPVVSRLASARASGELPPLAFDLSGPLTELEGRGARPSTIDAVVEAGDLFVAGEVAIRSYCDHHDVDTDPRTVAAHLQDLGVTRAALTHGSDGATLVTPDRIVAVDAFDVDPVDTTGAGDAFIGGLIDAWLFEDESPEDAGRFAAAAAALNCTGEGARGGLGTREAVRAMIAAGWE